MSFILLGILNSQTAGGGPTGYWISLWDTGPGIPSFEYHEASLRPLAVYADNVTSDARQIVHFDSADGNIVSQFYVEGVSPDTRVTEDELSQTANYDYLAVSDESTGNSDVVVLQFDPQSSSPNWQQRFGLGTGGSNNVKLRGLGVDSSDNSYFTAIDQLNGRMVLSKLNSSGTVQWQKQSSDIDNPVDCSTNPSGQTIVRDLNNNFIMFDSSGDIDWQKGGTITVNGTTSNFASTFHRVDSSGNTYTAGYALSESNYMAVFKFNSSGVVQWQKYFLATSTPLVRGGGFAADGSLIIVTQETGKQIILSIDTSDGSINWQRQITHSLSGTTATGISSPATLNNDGTGVVLNNRDNAGGSYATHGVIQYPQDGSITGTYTIGSHEYVIAAASLSTGDITNSFSTTAFSTSSGSYSLGSTSLTIGATSYSITPTAI